MAEILAKAALDVGIVSGDPAPLLAFYREAFGFEELPKLEIPGTGVIHKLACGQSVLRIFQPQEPPESDSPPGGFSSRAGFRYMNLEVHDARAVVESARAAGGKVLIEAFELRPGRIVSQVADPDGNVVEVGEG